ncbi:hypothetical protein [Nocardioides sp.]|uniref:hypothetical protein n=1 Tax=Nocardioides sp. TaxID=35761 RepID=UPI0035197347
MQLPDDYGTADAFMADVDPIISDLAGRIDESREQTIGYATLCALASIADSLAVLAGKKGRT